MHEMAHNTAAADHFTKASRLLGCSVSMPAAVMVQLLHRSEIGCQLRFCLTHPAVAFDKLVCMGWLCRLLPRRLWLRTPKAAAAAPKAGAATAADTSNLIISLLRRSGEIAYSDGNVPLALMNTLAALNRADQLPPTEDFVMANAMISALVYVVPRNRFVNMIVRKHIDRAKAAVTSSALSNMCCVYLMAGDFALYAGSRDEAIRLFEAGIEAAEHDNRQQVGAQCRVSLAILLMMECKLMRCSELLEPITSAAVGALSSSDGKISATVLGMARAVEALVHLQRNDPTQAQNVLNGGALSTLYSGIELSSLYYGDGLTDQQLLQEIEMVVQSITDMIPTVEWRNVLQIIPAIETISKAYADNLAFHALLMPKAPIRALRAPTPPGARTCVHAPVCGHAIIHSRCCPPLLPHSILHPAAL
jgi:hypothetical protein